MKKIPFVAWSAFFLIMLVTVIFYLSLYRNQIEYSNKLLDRQVMIAGSDIDNTSMYIISDLTELDFSDDFSGFFSDHLTNERVMERMKLYYSKYEDIVVGLMLYNRSGDVYTLFKDEERNAWLDGSYKAQAVPEIFETEKLEAERDRFRYYLPVLKDGRVLGNLVITVDFKKYFSRIFTKYNLEQYQWQWVVNDTGGIIFDNHGGEVSYSQLNKIAEGVSLGSSGRITHTLDQEGISREILSAYYPVTLFGLDFGMVFSAPTDFFRKYIVRNSFILGLLTMLTLLFIIILFRYSSWRQDRQLKKTAESEKTLLSLMDKMPAGIIVCNAGREILKANREAAQLFGYDAEGEMTGKLVPDLSGNEFAGDSAGQDGNGNIIRLGGASGEKVIFRNSIPVQYQGESATLDVLVDVTSLELARRHEADANIAKSELLARMSFEIRTPLSGILGMTDMLNRSELSEETKEVAMLLRRSADLLLNIINDIFDVSKVETGKMILDEIPFRLREQVDYCINLVRRENPDTLVKITSSVEQSVPESLIGDPYRLRQVIMNLLNNSLTGTKTGEIKVGCRVKRTEGNQFLLEFTVTDTGTNYTKAEIKKLFGDYITNLSDRSDWSEDLKLGPVLARQLTELMGGELHAESPAGKDSSGKERGLKVTFTVSVHLNEKIAKEIDLSRYNETGMIRTLAITGAHGRDDDFLGIMHRIGLPVSVTSFQKHTVSQIKTSLQSEQNRYILLVIFDEQEADGFEAARELMDAGMTSQHIVLMFTSRDPKGHYARCVDMGIDHLLVKPFAGEDLISVLKDHFPGLRDHRGTVSSDRSDVPVILVVDDNYLNRKVEGSLLKVLGVDAEFASGADEAIAMADAKSYDLILMDLIMPEKDGFEAARTILEMDSEAIIVALSADTMPETRTRVEQTGMKELLSKPVTVEELRRVITRYHRQD
ncbi:MAG: response regulator [Bacteroidales bacterium]|jgi:signal transduction histidine kinase/CheY-like chemotaxis protein|nr:response regulator [Bacteroidales bacterium]